MNALPSTRRAAIRPHQEVRRRPSLRPDSERKGSARLAPHGLGPEALLGKAQQLSFLGITKPRPPCQSKFPWRPQTVVRWTGAGGRGIRGRGSVENRLREKVLEGMGWGVDKGG